MLPYHFLSLKKVCFNWVTTYTLIVATLLFPTCFLNAQISIGGIPPSWQLSDNQQLTTSVSVLNITAFDFTKVQAQDVQSHRSPRFAAPIITDISMENNGHWTTLQNGDRLWQLKIVSEDALALAFQYDQFYLPVGARLFMYSPDRQQLLGAYSAANNSKSGKMLTGLIQGEAAILEYYEPLAVSGQGKLHIFQIQHAYRPHTVLDAIQQFQTYAGSFSDFGYGASLDCEININCAEGANVQDEKRGIARILMVAEEGMVFCSGTLLNNTNQDGTPYILSAYHCMQGYTPKYDFWRFDFNYENNSCHSTSYEPDYQSMIGCTKKAGNPDSDFILVEINQTIPPDFNVYYNGWNRENYLPPYATMIHHPAGDVKKVSLEDDPLEVYQRAISWSNNIETPSGYHLRSVFDKGTFEIGSSGAALLDQQGLVVGQLHGGNASCTRYIGFFGRFFYSWDNGQRADKRLKDWLDPTHTGVTKLAGRDGTNVELVTLSGTIVTENNEGISGVQVSLNGATNFSTSTGTNGRFLIQNVPSQQDYTLTLHKDGDDMNGISTSDVVKIRKHILRLEMLDSPYRFLAADINDSQDITTFDVIKLRKLVLGLETALTDNQSWRFVPADFSYSQPLEQPFEYEFAPIIIENITTSLELNFMGIKVGDMNFSATP